MNKLVNKINNIKNKHNQNNNSKQRIKINKFVSHTIPISLFLFSVIHSVHHF